MKTRIWHFLADRRGTVALLAAFSLVPIVLTIGAGAELMRLMTLRTELQNAVDSAAVAAVKASAEYPDQGWTQNANGQWVRKADSIIPTVADNYVQQNFANNYGLSPVTTTTTDWDKRQISITSKVSAPTYLLGLANINSFDLSASATGSLGSAGKILEIAIAFDITQSMVYEGRSTAAIAAAKKFINTVMNYSDGTPNPNTRVALVPFNSYVNVGDKNFWSSKPIGVKWLTSTDDLSQIIKGSCYPASSIKSCNYNQVDSTCTVDGVTTSCKKNIEPPLSCTILNYPERCIQDKTVVSTWTGCVGTSDNVSDESEFTDTSLNVPAILIPAYIPASTCPKQRIIYLSANTVTRDGDKMTISRAAQTKLGNALDTLIFSGETYIAPGLLWAWRTLSPLKPVAGWPVTAPGQTVTNTVSNVSPDQNMLRIACGDYNPNIYGANPDTVGLNATEAEKPGCPYGLSEKIIVLMTDGINTRSVNFNKTGKLAGRNTDTLGRHEARVQDDADAKLANVCKNVKAGGITIYTIAFKVNDASTENLLKSCATGDNYFFNSNSSDALANAFASIGQNITRLKIVK